MKFFEQTYRLRVSDEDENGRLKTSALLGILQDCATRASDNAGAAADWLYERGTVWFLNSVSLRVYSDLCYLNTLRIETFVDKFGGLFAKRGYRVYLGDEIIAECTSFWFMVDLARRKPIKPPEEVIGKYIIYTPCIIESERVRLKLPDGRPEKSVEIIVRAADTDRNGHVNNAVYADYVSELVGAINEFDIEYKAEAKAGDVLTVALYDDIIVFRNSGAAGNDKTICAIARVKTK